MKVPTEDPLVKTPSSIIWLKRIAWISAWLLLFSFFIMLVSGWGISNTEIIYKASLKLIDRGLANAIHRATHLPVAIFLIIHVLVNLKLRLYRRNKRSSLFVDAIFIIAGLSILILVFYLEFLY